MTKSKSDLADSTDKNVAKGASYRDAGVDLDKYQESMARLPSLMHRTFTSRVIKLDGGFAGLFRLDNKKRLFSRGYRDPVLVSGTDGVGSKLSVAQMAGKHDTIGIDLVAMCVNDIICTGAEPLFFLDYIAMSHDDPEMLEQVVRGISEGCLQSEAALLGGETAIMPDTYKHGDYDVAGFAVGVVENRNLIDGSTIAADDIVIGVNSNGVHSNGYSLVRKIVFEIAGLDCQSTVEELGSTVGEELLRPTLIYAPAVKTVLKHYQVKQVVHGIAHITGGGLAENIERILPSNVDLLINSDAWQLPPVFSWLQSLGNVEQDEMRRVFNMGIGLALIVSPFYAENISRRLSDAGFANQEIGKVASGQGRVRYN